MKTLQKDQPHVVIIGAGFGGLRAARALAGAPVRVTIIDRNNYHLFQPLLYQVATAGLSGDQIAYPVRGILRRQKNVQFLMAEAREIDPARRQVRTSNGALDYDYLILALGGVTHTYGLPGVKEHGFGLKGLQDANAIRNHLLRMFELAAQEEDESARRALLTFVVAGGGPSGVESAGALSELMRHVLKKEYPSLNFDEVRVLLLEASDRLLPAMPDDLSASTVGALERKGVEVRFGAAVKAYDGQTVSLADGAAIASRTMIWAAGIQAAPLMDTLHQMQSRQGRVRVLPTLQLPGMPEVFVIGDAAYLEDAQGRPLPMVAPVAMQQGEQVARNILRLARNQLPEAFIYRDPGSLATIGRNQAVAHIAGLKFKGFLAWMVWLVVHIMQLIGFRNRLVVLINWAYEYLFYDRAVRLIDPDSRC